MFEPTLPERILGHIAAIGRRGVDDNVVLADALYAYAWPDGGTDRSDGDARNWFQRHSERLPDAGPTPIPVTCGCRINRCLVCN